MTTKQEMQALQAKMNNETTREMTQKEMLTYACDHKDANTGVATIDHTGRCTRCRKFVNLQQLPEAEVAGAVDTLVTLLDQIKFMSNCNVTTLQGYAEVIHLIKSLPEHYKTISRVKQNHNAHHKAGKESHNKYANMFPKSAATGKRQF